MDEPDRHKLTMTVDEAATALGISRRLAYSMAREGHLPALRLGRRVLISAAALHEMLESAGSSGASTSGGLSS